VVKANSYAHLPSGITTEEPRAIEAGQDKLLRKERRLVEELERLKNVERQRRPEVLDGRCMLGIE